MQPRSEITPYRRAVLVALHHGLPQIGLAPVSFKKIEEMRNGEEVQNGKLCVRKSLKQPAFNVLQRKEVDQKRKLSNPGGERSLGWRRSSEGDMHGV